MLLRWKTRRLLGRPRITWLKTIHQDLKSKNLSMNEATDMAQKQPLEIVAYTWCYAHLVVHGGKEDRSKMQRKLRTIKV